MSHEAGKATANKFAESRRHARQIALQALYEWDVVKHHPATALERLVVDYCVEEDRERVLDYALVLVEDVRNDGSELDGLIQAHATAYPVGQIAAVDRKRPASSPSRKSRMNWRPQRLRCRRLLSLQNCTAERDQAALFAASLAACLRN